MLLHKLWLTQIAVNWVEIIRIRCTDWAFGDSQVHRGYVSMAALNEMSQRFTFQILISSLPKLICSGNQDEIFNKKPDTEFSSDAWFWQAGTARALHYTLGVWLRLRDKARETRFDLYVTSVWFGRTFPLVPLYPLFLFGAIKRATKLTAAPAHLGAFAPFCNPRHRHRQALPFCDVEAVILPSAK